MIDVRRFLEESTNPYFEELHSMIDFAEKIEWCLAWVRKNITYQSDIIPYWQMSEETLYKKTGDCEDGAILLANMLMSANVDVKLVAGTHVNGQGHVAVAWKDSNHWWILDWTRQQIFLPLSSVFQKVWFVWDKNTITRELR